MSKENSGSLVLMLASTMTKEQIVDMLESALKDYKNASLNDKQDAYGKLEVTASILIAKNIAPTPETAILMGKKIDDLKRMDNLINPEGTSSSN